MSSSSFEFISVDAERSDFRKIENGSKAKVLSNYHKLKFSKIFDASHDFLDHLFSKFTPREMESLFLLCARIGDFIQPGVTGSVKESLLGTESYFEAASRECCEEHGVKLIENCPCIESDVVVYGKKIWKCYGLNKI